jgi:hypothetical protein
MGNRCKGQGHNRPPFTKFLNHPVFPGAGIGSGIAYFTGLCYEKWQGLFQKWVMLHVHAIVLIYPAAADNVTKRNCTPANREKPEGEKWISPCSRIWIKNN